MIILALMPNFSNKHCYHIVIISLLLLCVEEYIFGILTNNIYDRMYHPCDVSKIYS